jgi:hypothetical protein
MRSHFSTKLPSRKVPATSSLRGRCAVAAIALLTCAVGHAAALPSQQLTVAFTNAFPNGSVNSLTMPNSGPAIAATNPLLTGGTAQNIYTALTWVTNPVTSTLDLIYADAEQHKIWRLPGPSYQTPTVIFSWSGKGSGPPYPVGLAADSAGNVYAISPSSAWDAPGVWVLPITAAGTYGAPLLIDKTFQDPTTHKPVSTLALTEVQVAGTGTAATPPAAGAWSALDLLVLVADPLNTRVMRYSQSQIQSVLTPPSHTPLQGPTSTVVTPAQFSTQAILKIPPLAVGMDIEQDPNTGDMSLLFSTAGGRILDFDSVQNAFITPYAINLGLGLTRLKVGTYQNTPYVFVGHLGGQILEFKAPTQGSSNTTPFARVSNGVGNPTDLAVTTSGSTLASSCVNTPPGSPGCAILPQLSLDITGAGTSNIPPNAYIVADSCTIATAGDPGQNLDIGDSCSNMPHVQLPSVNGTVMQVATPGAGLYAAKITASTVNQHINNTLTSFSVDPVSALGGATQLCGMNGGPIVAWTPVPPVTSNGQTLYTEPLIPEVVNLSSDTGGLLNPAPLIDITVACNSPDPPPAGKGSHPSILIEGAALVGLNSTYIGGEFNNLQTAFNWITQPQLLASLLPLPVPPPPGSLIADTAPPTIVPAIQGYITNSLNYFNQGVAVAAAGGSGAALPYYSCALSTLWTGAQYVNTLANTPATFTGSITGNVLTVTAFASGAPIAVGQNVAGTGITPGTTIISLGTGTGGMGTYNLSATPNVGSEAMTTSVFNAGPLPYDDNPSGTLLMRFDHLYYDINILEGPITPITTDALTGTKPACAAANVLFDDTAGGITSTGDQLGQVDKLDNTTYGYLITPTASGNLGSISAPVANFSGYLTGASATATFYVYTNSAAGTPGQLLDTLTATVGPGDFVEGGGPFPIVVFPSTNYPSLSSAQSYWVVLSSTAATVLWNTSLVPCPGTHLYATDNGVGEFGGEDNYYGAMTLTATPPIQ